MISAFLIQQERRRGRRVLRQRDGAPEVGGDLISAGLRPSSTETRSRGKTVEVCGRAAVAKVVSNQPENLRIYRGKRGSLALGSKDPQGVRPSQGGQPSPSKPSPTRFGRRSPSPFSHLLFFFSFLFDFLPMAHRAFLGCPTSPLKAGAPPPRPMGFPGVGCPPGELPEPIRHSRYIPGNSENLPVIK